MVSINDVLKASKGLPVDDIFAQLWGRKLSGGYTIDVYTGTLPAVLTGTKAGYLHKYKIYGNTEQTGTPTPSDPIYPSECGERTENLFDDNATDTNNGYVTGQFLKSDNTTSSNSVYNISEYIKLYPEQTYTISRYAYSASTPGICFYDVNKDYISGLAYSGQNVLTFTTPTNTKYIRMTFRSGLRPILNEGSTAPTTYIPYGYKLPLTSAGQGVDIYLGESQTTRRIRKLVLTGTEDIGYDSAYTRFSLKLPDCLMLGVRRTPAFCTHYEVIDDGRALSSIPDNSMYSHNAESRWYIKTTDYSTVDAFKSYLAAQYAAGTPVTIWYVLATEETGTVNEPLRKIGNYADTIDSTQTSAQIPTSAGSTTISWAGDGLAPSEVELTYERK